VERFVYDRKGKDRFATFLFCYSLRSRSNSFITPRERVPRSMSRFIFWMATGIGSVGDFGINPEHPRILKLFATLNFRNL
jgi:hypothetical protein